MNTRLLAAAAAACALVLLGVEPAGAAPASAASARVEAEVGQWLAQVGTWGQTQSSIYGQESQLFNAIMTAQTTAVGFYTKHDRKGGTAWAQEWSQARLAEVQAYRARFEQLLSTPLPEPPPEIASAPQITRILVPMRKVIAASRQRRVANADLMERLIADTVKFAQGDDKTAHAMPHRILETAIAMIESEDAGVETMFPLVDGPHVAAGDLLRAQLAFNRAMIELLRTQQQEADGEQVDKAAAADRIRQQVAIGREAIGKIVTDAELQRRDLATKIDLNSPLGQKVTAMVATFPASAAVEEKFAAALDTIANHLAKGDMDESPEAQAALDSTEALTAQRLELDVQRKKIIAGPQ